MRARGRLRRVRLRRVRSRRWRWRCGNFARRRDARGGKTGSVAELRGEFVALGEVKQAGGKVVSAWAVEGDFDVARLKSNTFEMEWPMKSGRMKSFPEVDRAEWFGLDEAREKILKGQAELVERLARLLS